MRRENADALTAREREVLDLIRLGLTNEEIAGRLGITLDGAKYHVSQILSKLGVASREEAAAVGVAERRPWWLRAAVWTKIAGAGTVVAGVAGPAVLAWGVLRTEGGDEPVEASCVVPSVAQQRGEARTIDDVFATIATEVPEFGGYSLDPDGRGLQVVLTDPTIDLTAVCASIARHSAGFSVANLMVSPLKGDYGFAELAQWYAQAQDSAFAIDGLVSTDIDEVRNRIVVGAATEDAEAAIAQALGELGIPAEAVVIEHAEPVTLDE